MKIILVVVTLAAAALADRSHLQTPGGSSSRAAILGQDQHVSERGFRYNYHTSDGTTADQQGHVRPGGAQDSGSLSVQGSFSYVGPDGQTYRVRYTADENGYRPEGAHLPTPPPAPQPTQRSLNTQGYSQGHYTPSRSGSFSADTGYFY